jgi:Sulfotransferase family
MGAVTLSRLVDPLRPWNAPLEIPDCPRGWKTGPPTYVGIGAQRCGTSWWYDSMRRHPRIRRSPLGKEVHYFDRFWRGDAPENVAAEYASLFPRPEGQLVGEWTPRYLADFWSVRLLRKAAPDARILVMLRDPVARYRSAVARLQRMAEEQGDRVRLPSIGDATWRGFYFQQLRHVFEHFPREQVLVLQFERCVQDPVGEMERTWRFVGAEPLSEPPERLLKHRQAGRGTPQLEPQLGEDLAERYREDSARLAELCPEIDLSLWKSVAAAAPSADEVAVDAALR